MDKESEVGKGGGGFVSSALHGCFALSLDTVSAVGGARPLLVRTLAALESSPHLTNRKAALLDSDAESCLTFLQLFSLRWTKLFQRNSKKLLNKDFTSFEFVHPPLDIGRNSIRGSKKTSFHAASSTGSCRILRRATKQHSSNSVLLAGLMDKLLNFQK